LRTDVGDRYVVQAMREGGFNLGGEQSGHIVMSDYVTTGDGLIAGLQFLNAMIDSEKPASKLAHVFDPYPQLLENIRYTDTNPLEAATVKAAIAEGERALSANGRLLIRKSGTEPLVRVMGECEDAGLLRRVVGDIAAAVNAAA
jgi:phosphoglucosamine mutase